MHPGDRRMVILWWADHRPGVEGFMIYVHMAALITHSFQNSQIEFTVIIQFVMSKR